MSSQLEQHYPVPPHYSSTIMCQQLNLTLVFNSLLLESVPVIAAPSMWTRPQIADFKEKIRQDADSVITVGRGEVVTVRVPTHEEGSYLFWEFATDNYDIGFGVYFEWTDSPNTAVSVHVSESSEDEDEDEGSSYFQQILQ